MEKFLLLLLLYFSMFLKGIVAFGVGGLNEEENGVKKLFVFGDSYADTGNTPKFFASSWKEPYGITFPGKPTGRFSDGRVLTDYVASFLGIDSPLPYESWKAGQKLQKDGINFAYGGTGVFDTIYPEPNMTTQVNFFQQLLQQKVYTKQDPDSSIALVSLAGNDYGTYLAKNRSLEGLPAFSKSVIDQLVLNLKRIHSMGVKKIAVVELEPLGCLPRFTKSFSFTKCNGLINMGAKVHNKLLKLFVEELNQEINESAFVILDLYSAFMSALKAEEYYPGGASNLENLLKPCCLGVNGDYSCGSIDNKGNKEYSVCNNPQQSFFWDNIHPSNHGWELVYSSLQSSLKQLF